MNVNELIIELQSIADKHGGETLVVTNNLDDVTGKLYLDIATVNLAVDGDGYTTVVIS